MSFKQIGLPDSFVAFDTEFTAWEGSMERGWSKPDEHRELVQIGAVKVNGEDLQITDEYQQLLTPTRNPQLSDYFTNLTGITQQHVDEEGVEPVEGIAAFMSWVGDLPMYCYGWDGNVIEENARLLAIPSPLGAEQVHNVKDVFSAHGIDADQYSSGTIVSAFGQTPRETAHDALSDATSIVEGLRLLLSA